MKTRNIPATMATQHPDNASEAYWHGKAYIPTHEEATEAYLSFSELGIKEYKWDWEGKLVDESVVERLFGAYFPYFQEHPLGKERFLTFRLPNPKVETEFRVGRAFMNLFSAASVAEHFGFEQPPLFEVILPMTETAEEMFAIQEAFEQMHALKHPIYHFSYSLTVPHIIPLFESVPVIIDSDRILSEYLALYERKFKKLPTYMRPYVARSDPALNSGLIPTVLAIKIALSNFKTLEDETGIPLYPIIGAGSLPFRGGLTPEHVSSFADEYAGIRTTTIQSAFRYDYPKEKVIQSLLELESILPTNQTRSIPPKDQKALKALIQELEKPYKQTIEHIASLINIASASVPKRRERVQHTGLFGYSRGEGHIKLPRAITFTAALYSLGIPPEIIGTGRAIARAKALGKLDLVEKYYLHLRDDLRRAGRFVNKNNVAALARTSSAWEDVVNDIKEIEKYLGETLEPLTNEEKEHHYLTTHMYAQVVHNTPMHELVEKAGRLRKSIG